MIYYQKSCVVIYSITKWIKVTNQTLMYCHQDWYKGKDVILIHSSLVKNKHNGSHQKLQSQKGKDLLYFIDGVEMVIQLPNLENCVLTKGPQLLLEKYQVLKKYLVDITHFHG